MVDVDVDRIVNVYKPPPTRLQASDLPMFPHPVFYAGNFNCSHFNWDYRASSGDGKCLVAWASLNGLVPLHDPKDVATFHSGRWNTSTNPDLTIVSVGLDSRVPDRRMLEKFPRSQRRPSLIVPPRLALPAIVFLTSSFYHHMSPRSLLEFFFPHTSSGAFRRPSLKVFHKLGACVLTSSFTLFSNLTLVRFLFNFQIFLLMIRCFLTTCFRNILSRSTTIILC